MARRVKREVDAGNEVAVVVSAMAGVTNQLVDWTRETSRLHDAREYDVVVASGEQVTAGLMALALQELGVDARSWLGWQIPIRTDGVHGKARIEAIETARASRAGSRRARSRWSPGFRGSARAAGSRRWAAAAPTPRRWRSPRRSTPTAATSSPMSTGSTPPIRASLRRREKLDKITYEEMLEMASQGAKVLQTRSVEMAMNHRVRVQVLSSFSDAPGTLVVDEDEIVEKQVVSGIAYSRDEAKITLCRGRRPAGRRRGDLRPARRRTRSMST